MTAIQILQTQASDRREYYAPTLVLFGLVSDLTAAGSKPGNENDGNRFGNNSNTQP